MLGGGGKRVMWYVNKCGSLGDLCRAGVDNIWLREQIQLKELHGFAYYHAHVGSEQGEAVPEHRNWELFMPLPLFFALSPHLLLSSASQGCVMGETSRWWQAVPRARLWGAG